MPSHYLSQCWYIVNLTIRNKFHWNVNRNSYIFIHKNAFEKKTSAKWRPLAAVLLYQLSSRNHVMYMPRFYAQVALAAFGQSYDCSSANELTLQDMVKIELYQNSKHNKVRTVSIFSGMCCTTLEKALLAGIINEAIESGRCPYNIRIDLLDMNIPSYACCVMRLLN